MVTYEEPTRRMRGADRRSQILEMATEVFGKRGFRGSALRDVADACGVTEPLIYKYFRSKRELFLATIDHATELAFRAVAEEVGAAGTGAQTLKAFARVFDGQTGHKLGTGVLVQAAAEAGKDPDIRAAVTETITKRLSTVRDLVVKGKSDGSLAAGANADVLAWQLLSAVLAATMLAGVDVGFPGVAAVFEATLAKA